MRLDLVPRGPCFSNEDVDRYWPPGSGSKPLPVSEDTIGVDMSPLFSRIDKHLPHLRDSFICSDAWWKARWGLPQTHMFKYLLFRGVRDIMLIFNKAQTDSMPEFESKLAQANHEARLVWLNTQKPYGVRQTECEAIWGPILDQVLSADRKLRSSMPSGAEEHIDRLFTTHFPAEKYLLIGRADEAAYEVQGQYAGDLSRLLGSIRSEYGVRALACLGPVWGCSSMPLLTKSSVKALWKLCNSDYYRIQLSMIYRWIQPFAGSFGHVLGCDYVSSLRAFLKPVKKKSMTLFTSFYGSLMMWSVDLHVVALLDLYLGPMSEVTELVRGQLLQEQEAESIRQAIEDFAKGTSTPETLYGHYLSYSGLDFSARQEALVSIVVSGELHRALFDLTLGQRVRSLQMSLYTEVHNAREMVQHFFAEFEDDTVRGAGEKLWWDEIHNDGTVHEPWLAQNLRNDVNFLPILHSWLDDSGRLQLWLDSQLEESIVVNNPNSERPVVSYSSAVAIIEFAKHQGNLFDLKRDLKFQDVQGLVRIQYENLGLFKTRLPRFPQLFFHNFNESELTLGLGQASQCTSSFRAAKIYLRERVRLESKCGISDIWYHYVERNQDILTSKKQVLPPLPTPPPHLHLHLTSAPPMCYAVQWRQQHKILLEKRKQTFTTAAVMLVDDDISKGGSQFSTGNHGSDEEDPLEHADTPDNNNKEDTLEYADTPENDEEDPLEDVDTPDNNTSAGAVKEEEIQDFTGNGSHASNTGGAQKFRGESEADEFQFDSFPATPSFHASLAQVLDGFGIQNAPCSAIKAPAQSSAPEERFSRADTKVALEEAGRDTPMEGVEASQPTTSGDARTFGCQSGEDMDMDSRYVPDVYPWAAGKAEKHARNSALSRLKKSRQRK